MIINIANQEEFIKLSPRERKIFLEERGVLFTDLARIHRTVKSNISYAINNGNKKLLKNIIKSSWLKKLITDSNLNNNTAGVNNTPGLNN